MTRTKHVLRLGWVTGVMAVGVLAGFLPWSGHTLAQDSHDHSTEEKHGRGHDDEGAAAGKKVAAKEEHEHSPPNASSEAKAKDHDDHDHAEHGGAEAQHSENEHDEEGHTEGGHGHEEEESSSVGPDKAIQKAEDHGRRIQLSIEALRTLGIDQATVSPVPGKVSRFQIPAGALVSHQDEHSVYRRSGDWFESLLVQPITKHNGQAMVVIESAKLRPGDEVVTSGTEYLRLAELEASGKGGEGHAH